MENENQEKNSVAKDVIKKIIFSKVKKILLIVLLICMILFIIVASCWHVKNEDGKWSSNEQGTPKLYTKNTIISETDGITVDKNKLVEDALISMGYTQERIQSMSEQEIIEILRIEYKLGKVVTSFDECTVAEILWCTNSIYDKYLKTPEELQILLDAELITQYPKIDGLEGDSSKLNGIIEFERYTTDPDTKKEYIRTLKYISNEEFTAKFNNYQQTGNEEIFDYFTLDEEGNAKIATWTRDEGSYSSNNTTSQTNRKKIRTGVTEEEINSNYDSRYTVNNNNDESITATYTTYYITEQTIYYKNYVQQYTLSFEYLWSLLTTIGKESNQFVFNLAQLAYNSEIKIGIFDNINETIRTDTESYREEFEYRYVLLEDGSIDEDKSETEGWDYVHTNIITTYQDTVQMEVIYANVWCAEITVKWNNTVYPSDKEDGEYDNIYEEPNLPEGNTDTCRYSGQKIEWYTDDEHRHWIDYGEEEEESDIEYDEYICNHKRTINRVNTSKTDFIISQYQKEPSVIRRKDDIDESTDDNFVKALRRDDNAYTVLSKSINFEWWSQILLENEDSSVDNGQLVDLTKYFIYKATNNAYFETEFDFNEFEPSGFSNFSLSSGGASYESLNLTESDLEILYKITSAERGDGTQEQQEYVVSVILNRVLSSKFPNTVYGVVFQKNQFQPTRNGAYEKAQPSQTTIDAVNNVVKNGDTSQCAIYFMTPKAAKGQQSWLQNCTYLFNDVSEDLKDADTHGSHNFYTTQDAVDELQQYIKASTSGAPVEGSVSEKLNYLFPNGIPTTQGECSSYIVTVPIALTSKSGEKKTGYISVHQSLAADVQRVFQKAQDEGFKIYEAAGYSYRVMNNGGSGNLSHHSYGVAIDINVNENYSRKGTTIYAGSFWNPAKSEFSIPADGVLVKAFESIGWKWGGNWSGNYQDYMHFSYTGR